MKDTVTLSAELGGRLCDVLAGEDELVSKWIAVAEVIGPDGRRWLRTFFPTEASPWDNVGLLTVACDAARATDWDDAND